MLMADTHWAIYLVLMEGTHSARLTRVNGRYLQGNLTSVNGRYPLGKVNYC